MHFYDKDGYVITFDVSQKELINKFFEKNGFVVIGNVLNDDEINETIDEFFSLVSDNGKECSDEDLEKFYADQPFGKLGIIGSGPDLQSIAQLNNRQNPRVYEAFCTVLKNKNLIVEHDRLGAMRPTLRGTEEKVDWRTRDKWIHLDCNPMLGTASIGGYGIDTDRFNPIDFKETLVVQGLITLTDAREEDGGFHCIPGGHRIAREWSDRMMRENKSMQVEPDDPIRHGVLKIPIRKGCLLVWNTLLFHGNHPNYSTNWRMVQYIRMIPYGVTPYIPLFPEMKHYPIGFQMSSLGRKLFGLDSYASDNEQKNKQGIVQRMVDKIKTKKLD
jgi:hypothetical protein